MNLSLEMKLLLLLLLPPPPPPPLLLLEIQPLWYVRPLGLNWYLEGS